jgi:hypothetical protein
MSWRAPLPRDPAQYTSGFTPALFAIPTGRCRMVSPELNLRSVKYRVGRAVARRGREIGTDRLDVELALLACHWYGSAVLQPK